LLDFIYLKAIEDFHDGVNRVLKIVGAIGKLTSSVTLRRGLQLRQQASRKSSNSTTRSRMKGFCRSHEKIIAVTDEAMMQRIKKSLVDASGVANRTDLFVHFQVSLKLKILVSMEPEISCRRLSSINSSLRRASPGFGNLDRFSHLFALVICLEGTSFSEEILPLPHSTAASQLRIRLVISIGLPIGRSPLPVKPFNRLYSPGSSARLSISTSGHALEWSSR
jgi:hypothetical protein